MVVQAQNSLFGGFEYELTVGDLLGSSKAQDPSSFFRIRYTTNMTQRMAQISPTTAPPTTAETKTEKGVKTTLNQTNLYFIVGSRRLTQLGVWYVLRRQVPLRYTASKSLLLLAGCFPQITCRQHQDIYKSLFLSLVFQVHTITG